jgi:hypothetical protein
MELKFQMEIWPKSIINDSRINKFLLGQKIQ